MPPKPIIITPSPQHEGEPGNSNMPLPGANDLDDVNQDQPSKGKWKRREEKMSVDVNEPQKTCRICTNYKCLNE
jgi:hypothetical protein